MLLDWSENPQEWGVLVQATNTVDSSNETDLEIQRDQGIVQIRRKTAEDPYEVRLVPNDPAIYIPRASCQSTFSLELILAVLEQGDFAWLCDNLSRHEDWNSTPRMLKKQLFSYVAPEAFAGKRLLDFGCGNGASTMTMARLLPQAEIIGVELDQERIEFANRIKDFRKLSDARFLCSPSGSELPAGIGEFDFVMLSAVYEHLLPPERKTVMPLLWSVMRPGALIFINQTPYRYSPLEAHSTGLWFVNYMPDSVAHSYVRAFAGRNQQINKSQDWNAHLRGGLRGGTEREILRNLTSGNLRSARIAQPRREGIKDRADLWLSSTNPNRLGALKKVISSAFRMTDRMWGTIPALNLEVVIEKIA